MKQHPAWGVDVTAVTVRAVEIALNSEGRPRIIGWDLVDFAEDVDDLSALSRFATMARGMYHFTSRHKLHRSRVWGSLRSESAFNRTVVVPPVNDESLDRILEYEAQQQVPHPLDEVYWDRRVLAIRENGEVLATLFAVRKSLVEDRLRKFAKSGLPVDGIQLRPIALQNFCAYERLLEHGTIVIDVDYGGLQILIHHDDQSWFRVLPVGGVDFVQRLRETFGCSHRDAIRMASGQAKPKDKELFEACAREVAQDIADEAVQTVRYFFSARADVKPSGVVLFESHSAVPSMASALKRSLDLPVFKPKGFRHLEVDPKVVSAGIQEHFAGLAKAAGLALQGVGKAEVEVRLFPETVTRPIGKRRTGFVAAGLVLLALIGLAGWKKFSAANEIEGLRNEVAGLKSNAEQRSVVDAEINALAPAEQLKELAKPFVGRKVPGLLVNQVLSALEAATPEQRCYLVALKQGEAGPRAAQLVVAYPRANGPAGLDAAKAALSELSQKVGQQELIKAVKEGRQWESGGVQAEPPESPSDKPLRYRYLHRELLLEIGEASS